MTTLLSIERVKARYGPVEALRGVSLTVDEGEIVALIGANGAGKSTLLMTICGAPKAAEGRIVYAGQDITGTFLLESEKQRMADEAAKGLNKGGAADGGKIYMV